MGMFRKNPFDEPWTNTRKIAVVLYVAFFLLSAWVTSESLVRTFKFSPFGNSQIGTRIFWFIVACMILVVASVCLNLVRKSFEGKVSNRLAYLIVGGIVFLGAWFFILMANTHGIYYIMTINEQRQNELRNVKNQLELVKSNSESAFKLARTKFENEIEADIKDMKAEITNVNNPGRAGATNAIINRIVEKIGQEISMPSKAPTNASGLAQYAEELAKRIREITQLKLKVVDEKVKELRAFSQQDEYRNTLLNLDDLINNYDKKDEKDVVLGLRNSYSVYDKTQDYIKSLFKEPLISKYTELPLQTLPKVPVSIESERIDYVWGEYFGGLNINLVSFRWAIFFGLMFDVACYVIWYFYVLPEED